MNLPAFKFPKPLGIAVSLLPTLPALVAVQPRAQPGARSHHQTGVAGALARQAGPHPCDRRRLSLYFTINRTGFVACKAGETPDLAISATAHDFFLLGTRREDPDTLFFSRRLVVEGETELGLIAKNTLDSVELPKLSLSSCAPEKVLEKVAARLYAASR